MSLDKNTSVESIQNAYTDWLVGESGEVERGKKLSDNTPYDENGDPNYEIITGKEEPDIEAKIEKLIDLVIEEVFRALRNDMIINPAPAPLNTFAPAVAGSSASGGPVVATVTTPNVMVASIGAGEQNQSSIE